jgi:GT2 family glycosyltransferase
MKKTIAAVVVTYNRKELLVHCLEAIFNQSHSVNAIYIVDNKSNDGTPEYLLENKIIGQFPTLDSKINEKHSEIRTLENGNKIIINYIRKFENDGGAGGFYEGMKSAFEADFDWLWFMDDDGVPDKNQIEFLLKANKDSKIDYLNALVVNIERNNLLAFGLNGYKSIEDIKKIDLL